MAAPAMAELIYADRAWSYNASGGQSYIVNNFGIGFASNNQINTQWVTNNPNGSASYYNNGHTAPVMVFDLGAAQTIDGFSWMTYNSIGNSVKDLEFAFYGSDWNFSTDATPLYTQNFVTTTSRTDYQPFNLTNSVDAQYVVLTMPTNHGGDRVGIGDIVFDVTNVLVPKNVAEVTPGGNVSYYATGNLIDKNVSTQWCTVARTNPHDYFNNGGTPPVLKFDWDGDVKDIGGVTLRNYSGGDAMRDFTLNFYDADDKLLGTESMKMEAVASTTSNTFTFDNVPGVSYVTLTPTSNFVGFSTLGGGDRVGFNDIYFIGGDVSSTKKVKVAGADYVPLTDFIRPVNAVELSNGVSAQPLSYLYDGTGELGGQSWYTHGSGDYFMYFDAPVLLFELEEVTMLSGITLWGYGNNMNLWKEFSLAFYDENDVALDFSEVFFLDNDYIGLGVDEYVDFKFSELVYAKKVEMTILDNFYVGANGGDRVGLAEVAFRGVPTPEPATWLMLVLGAAGLWVVRRKNNSRECK